MMLVATTEDRPSVKANRSPVVSPRIVKPTEPIAAVRTADADEIEWFAQQSRRLEGRSPEEILTWAVERYFPRFTMATGLGPEGCVIISMLAKIEPRVYVFNLDTGYQFPRDAGTCASGSTRSTAWRSICSGPN